VDLKDWLVVIATVVAPLFAVQATRWLDRRKQTREEQLRVFRTLMSTRAATLDPRHVEALNTIDVVFSGKEPGEERIRSSWREYHNHLGDKGYPKDGWGTRRIELLVELLYHMATYLGFTFDKTHIKTQSYYPEGYGQIEDDNVALRKATLNLLSGRSSLGIEVRNPLPPAGPKE
jgi:hypothetical protein